MKTLPPLLCALAFASASASEQIVTLGDSLTFSYEAEFCFEETVTVFGFPTTIGDGFPDRVRNWIEILSNPAYRGDRFELGTRDSVSVDPPEDPPFDLYFRQSHNWAIPGLRVDGLRRFITGDPTATFISLMGADAEFSTLSQVVSYSDFNEATDFALVDFENQVQTTAERVVISIGGNDIRSVYGTIYDGGSPGTFVADFMADMVAIVERVQALKPDIQIVLANVPHVGITPKVRSSWPYDAVKTERVSAVLRDLNGQLANLAASKNIGYADIYTSTVRMIDPTKDLCVHGIPFGNVGTNTGAANPVWLNGPISDNFHPNTNGQVVIANEIIDAFNRHYQTGIAPLTSTEIHVSITPKSPLATYDMPFSTWAQRFGASGITAHDDSDGDGITAGVEFALGLDPTRRDSHKVTSGVVGNQMELAYPVRLPNSTQYTLTPGYLTTLGAPFTPFAVLPTPEADGLLHARIPIGAGHGFLQLKATTP